MRLPWSAWARADGPLLIALGDAVLSAGDVAARLRPAGAARCAGGGGLLLRARGDAVRPAGDVAARLALADAADGEGFPALGDGILDRAAAAAGDAGTVQALDRRSTRLNS